MNKLSLLKEELQKLGKSLSTVFNELPAEPVEQAKEGELKVSAVEIGGKVEAVQADGTLASVEDGDYMYGEDVLTIEGGQITAINGDKGEDKPAEEPTEEAKEELAEEVTETAQEEAKPNEEVQALKVEIESLKSTIEEIKASIAASTESEQAMAAQFTAQVTELNNTIKTLASIPVEFSKTNESNKVKDAKDDKLTAALSIYGKRK